jgi:hypothetical protein
MREFLELPDVEYRFVARPRPYPADLRADWRISAVVLAVDKSRGKRASVPQLHVLVWAMLDPEHGLHLARALHGESTRLPPIRFDPAVVRAVDLAVGLGVLVRDGKRLKLAAGGVELLELIASEPEVMSQEKLILNDLGGSVSMVAVDRLAGLRT